MIRKAIDQINKEDIETLIENKVAECKSIEYKEKLPGNSDKNKKEFLADVSSFANAGGGHIIYGIQEKRDPEGKPTGIPESIKGLDTSNDDSEILKLENMIRDGIKPRIHGLQIQPLSGFQEKSILIIHIPKSWTSPHMVTFQSPSRFYSRTSNGKYPLDVQEIHSAFLQSEALGKKIREFRDSRLGLILADETPVLLDSRTRVVLHLIPFTSFDSYFQVDLQAVASNCINLDTFGSDYQNNSYNADGYINFGVIHDSELTINYTQVFRNGIIEAVSSSLIRENKETIPSKSFEEKLISGVRKLSANLKDGGFSPPVVVLLSLLKVKGKRMGLSVQDRFNYNLPDKPIHKDNLILPDLLIQDWEGSPETLLRPTFDVVWQACGMERSLYYDSKGNRTGNL